MGTTTQLTIARDWSHAPTKLERLSDLTLDLNLYPRDKVDVEVVHKYAKAQQAGAVFPPLKIGLLKGEKIIVDGTHRCGAYKENQVDFADCKELPFTSEAELFAEAVRLNADHGAAFNDADRKKSMRQLKKFKFKVQDIQKLLSVPAAEIVKESAAPIATIRTPWGEKKQIFKSETPKVPDAPGIADLIGFKNSLQSCKHYLEQNNGLVDGDPLIRELVMQVREALGRIKFT